MRDQGTALSRSDLPTLYVSEPGFDDMGSVLDDMGIGYRGLDAVDTSNADDAVMMINCNSKWTNGAIQEFQSIVNFVTDSDGNSAFNQFVDGFAEEFSDTAPLQEFVDGGGAAIVSDYAGALLTEFSETSFDTDTQPTTITADIEHGELAELLGRDTIDLEFDLPGWYKPERIPRGSEPLLRDARSGDVLAFQFSPGRGDIVYTAFHNHAQVNELERALLRLLVVLPIANSSNSTVRETYTTITGDTAVGSGDTVIQDADSGTQPVETATATQPADATPTGRTVTLDLMSGGRLEYVLGQGERQTIGRGDIGEFVPTDDAQYVSGTHLELRYESGNLTIRDMDSSNGTRLDGRDISDGEPRPVTDGSELTLANGAVTAVVSIE